MKSLVTSPEKASLSDIEILEGIWETDWSSTSSASKDSRASTADKSSESSKARFRTLVINIHNQLNPKVRKRKIARVSYPRRLRVRRAHRSPASTRRATVDSGGDDGGSGDPEPPRRLYIYSLSRVGGIALRMGGAA